MFNVTRDDAMSSFQTPLGPVVFNAPSRRPARPQVRRVRGKAVLDILMIALAFGFVATLTVVGSDTPSTVSVSVADTAGQ